MTRLARDETAKTVARDQTFRHEQGQGNIHDPCLADHEQDWQSYPVDRYSAISDDQSFICRFSDAFSSPLTDAAINLQPPSHNVLYQSERA